MLKNEIERGNNFLGSAANIIKKAKHNHEDFIHAIKKIIPVAIITIIFLGIFTIRVNAESDDFVIENDVITKYIGNESNVIIPDGIWGIGDSAFADCRSMNSIVIPDSVKSIGYNAFAYCTNLKEISIPSSITVIESLAFYSCNSLSVINLPSGLKIIKDTAFWNCGSLTSIDLPDGLTQIGEFAFFECRNLKDVTIPNSVEYIGKEAFNACSIEHIEIPANITRIEDGIFWRCSKLKSVNILGEVTYIGEEAFHGTGIESIDIPESVTCIGPNAFADSKLKNIVIPNGVDIIDSATFSGCTRLTEVVLPDTITSIDEWAFCGCSSLKSINIPSGVTTIEQSAFAGCGSLTNITIPDSVTSIGKDAFAGTNIQMGDNSFESDDIYIDETDLKVAFEENPQENEQENQQDSLYHETEKISNVVPLPIDYDGGTFDFHQLMKIDEKNIIFYKDSDILDHGEAHIIKNIIDGFVENNKTFYVSTPFINIDFNSEVLKEMSKKNADLSVFAKDNFCFFSKDEYINFLKEQLKNDDFISSVNPIASYEVKIHYWDDDLIKGDFTPKPIITFKLKDAYLEGADINKLGIYVSDPQTNSLCCIDGNYNIQDNTFTIELENPLPSYNITICEEQDIINIENNIDSKNVTNIGETKDIQTSEGTNETSIEYIDNKNNQIEDRSEESPIKNKIVYLLIFIAAIITGIIIFIRKRKKEI